MELIPITKIDKEYLAWRFPGLKGLIPEGYEAMYKPRQGLIPDGIFIRKKQEKKESFGYFDMHYGWVDL